jgi:hypothetical protein
MENLVKLFVIAGLSMAFAFTYAAETTATKDSMASIAKTAVTVDSSSSSSMKKSVTGNKPKPPTNWSKVKDLFL